MRRFLWSLVAIFALLAAGSIWAVRASRLGHCGCAASKDGCAEPCGTCCGPNGYADCFKNPSPSCWKGPSPSCCGH